jgi:hypothetical protein
VWISVFFDNKNIFRKSHEVIPLFKDLIDCPGNIPMDIKWLNQQVVLTGPDVRECLTNGYRQGGYTGRSNRAQ